MREKSVFKAVLLSLFVTFSIAVAAVLFELLLSISLSMTSGIAVAAGSFDARFFALLAVGLPLLFVVIYLLLKPNRLSK